MSSLRKVFLTLALAGIAAAALLRAAPAEAPLQGSAPASYAALFSFVDFTAKLPRLESGAASALGEMPEPGRGLFLLSGLAAALWVARRRLGRWQ